ncbi:MAG: LysM peptidoglycan-binding domain-containing protein [Sporomusaceae bacterium]|nr:LysM peptidoglycan-binding domain-containing protein [Sporomusaceae bacterium]
MKILLVLSLIISLWSITPLVSSNAYLDAGTYATVSVKSGDTVWGIAAKYVTSKDDIRDLSHAIKQLNGLNNNTQIFPGQVLKVPVKQ